MRNVIHLRHAGLLLILSAFFLSACSTSVRQNGESKDVEVKTPIGAITVKDNGSSSDPNKRVDIQTPFGDMHVHTNDVDAKEVGLSVYPGAHLAPRSQHNDSQADVNISTAWFGLKVVALKYESDDGPEKLLDYYRKDLAKYGDVLQCRNGKPVATSSTSSDSAHELTCKDHDPHSHGMNIDMSEHDKEITELKVGSPERQRIVAVRPNGKGSSFDLVYVQKRNSHETM